MKILNFGLISLLLLFFLITLVKSQNNTNQTLTSDYDDNDHNNQDESENIQSTINQTITAPPQEIINSPQAQVILPIRRRDTSKSELNIAPCGGVSKQKTHTLTNKGSNLDLIWEIINPISQGNCTVKISPGLNNEGNFTILYPIDIDTNINGEFPCGRKKEIESHQFRLPEDYVCDQCIVQWKWNTPAGILYSCSDITINGDKIEDCLAMCKNGGACFNGKCLCADDFYGDFCEKSYKNNSSGWGWVILVILLLGFIGGAVYYFSTNKVLFIFLFNRNLLRG